MTLNHVFVSPVKMLKCRLDPFGTTQSLLYALQCFDTVGLATGRPSGLSKVGCWFVGGDDLTGGQMEQQKLDHVL